MTAADALNPPVHVVAGVLRDAHGRVLLAQRGEGRHLAGMWEFPGGKIDPGETPSEALARELAEELGIEVLAAHPLIAVEHRYPSRRVLLDVYELEAVRGEPFGREGQPLRWVNPDALGELDMPEADRPVVTALRLPPCMAISPEPQGDRSGYLAELEATLAAGARLIQLRARQVPERELVEIAAQALSTCRRHGALLLLNGRPELALELGVDGVHLSGRRLAALSTRPLSRALWVGASCHDRAGLEHAVALGLDYAVLSPVHATRSHPAAEPLGWSRFAALRAGLPLPVYALGGIRPADLRQARTHGAQGVAGVSAFWKRRVAGVTGTA